MTDIMNTVWPSSDLAFGQQQNVANAVVAGNVVVDDVRKIKVVKAKKRPAVSAEQKKAKRLEKALKAKEKAEKILKSLE